MRVRNIWILILILLALIVFAGCAKESIFRQYYGKAIFAYTPPSTPNLADYPKQFLVEDDVNYVMSFEDAIVAPSGYNLLKLYDFTKRKICGLVTAAGYECRDMNNNLITTGITTGAAVRRLLSNSSRARLSAITGGAVLAADVNAVYRCYWAQRWSPTVINHFLSLDSSCGGHHLDGLLGYVYKSPQQNTVSLMHCYRSASSGGHTYYDHFVSATQCPVGSITESVIGYVPSASTSDTKTLYRCWNTPDDIGGGRFDHMVSADINCEGYTNENIEYYFIKEDAVVSALPPPPAPTPAPTPTPTPTPSAPSDEDMLIVGSETALATGGVLDAVAAPVCPSNMNKIGEIFEFHGRYNAYGRKWAFCVKQGVTGIVNTCSINSAADYGPWTMTCEPAACPSGTTALNGLIRHGYYVEVTRDRYNYVNMYSRVCLSGGGFNAGSVQSCTDTGTQVESWQCDDPNGLVCPSGQSAVDVVIGDPVYDAHAEQRGSDHRYHHFVYNRVCADFGGAPPPAPIPEVNISFSINKSSVYDPVNKRITYTIAIRNLGDALTNGSYQVLLKDILPSQTFSMDSVSPQFSMIFGNNPGWMFNSFDNTASSAYTNFTVTGTYGGITYYLSSGVFVIQMVVTLFSDLPNNTNVINYVNLTVFRDNVPVYAIEDTDIVVVQAQLPVLVIVGSETALTATNSGVLDAVAAPVCPSNMNKIGEIFEFHGRGNSYGRKWAFCAASGVTGRVNTCSINNYADYAPWNQACNPDSCPSGMVDFSGLIRHGYYVLNSPGAGYSYVNMYSRVCLSANAVNSGGVRSCADTGTQVESWQCDDPNGLVCPSGQSAVDVVIGDPVYSAYFLQSGHGPNPYHHFVYNRVCGDFKSLFTPITPPYPNGYPCTSNNDCNSGYCNPATGYCGPPPAVSSYRISIPAAIAPAALSLGDFSNFNTVLVGTCNDNEWVVTALGANECAALTPGRALILLQQNPYRLIIAGDSAAGVAVALDVLNRSAQYNLHGPRVNIVYGATFVNVSFPHCSDNVQNYGETGVDCGGFCPACISVPSYPPAAPGGPGAIGGGRRYVPPVTPEQEATECMDDWICDVWSECSPAGIQTRKCYLNDYPGCHLIMQRPAETQSCAPPYVAPAAPSCFDGMQNQGEEGIDCGGPCSACPRKKAAWLVPTIIILLATAVALGFLVYYVKFLKKPDVLSPLRKYVKETRAKNVSDAQIRQILQRQGWSDTDIGKGMGK